jgi:hypothetical protein
MEEKIEPLSEMATERKIQIPCNKHMDSEVKALVQNAIMHRAWDDDEIGVYVRQNLGHWAEDGVIIMCAYGCIGRVVNDDER